MSVRLAKPEDIEAVAKLAVTAFASSPSRAFKQIHYAAHTDLIYERHVQDIGRLVAGGNVAVMEVDQKIVGYAAWAMPEDLSPCDIPSAHDDCRSRFL